MTEQESTGFAFLSVPNNPNTSCDFEDIFATRPRATLCTMESGFQQFIYSKTVLSAVTPCISVVGSTAITSICFIGGLNYGLH